MNLSPMEGTIMGFLSKLFGTSAHADIVRAHERTVAEDAKRRQREQEQARARRNAAAQRQELAEEVNAAIVASTYTSPVYDSDSYRSHGSGHSSHDSGSSHSSYGSGHSSHGGSSHSSHDYGGSSHSSYDSGSSSSYDSGSSSSSFD